MAGDIFLRKRKVERAAFVDGAKRLAAILKNEGVQPDEPIALLLRNDIVFLQAIEACRYVGARYATLNWHGAHGELQHVLEDCGARVLLGHSDLLRPFAEAPPAGVALYAEPTPSEIADAYGVSSDIPPGCKSLPEALAATGPTETVPLPFRGLMAYTSGSTGRPKGIRRKPRADGADQYDVYAGLARMFAKFEAGDHFYTSAPLYHSAPSALSTMALAAGDVDIHIEPKFDPERFLADIERYRITHAYIVPTMMVRMLKLPEAVKTKYDTSSWRFAVTTGSPFPKEIKAQMIDWFGPIFWESYGASEIGFMTLISSEEAMAKPGSVGKIMPGGSAKILDENGEELPPGETGSIYVDLPMFGGFEYTNAEGDLSGQRYGAHASVGDMGYLDEDGYLYISDRKKDMIISGGANIFPAEIEAALIQSPEVADCAVFGAPHAEFGEMIVAAVTAKPGAAPTLESVRAFLDGRIARFKLPAKLDVHDALPREDSGKIFKQRLRAPYWEAAGRRV